MIRRDTLFRDTGDEDPLMKPRRTLAGDLDITPLIDVVFLLLIFFMVTSTMKGTPDIDVPVAHFGVGVPSRNATVITIRRAGSPLDPPVVMLGDGRGPEAGLEAIEEYIEAGVRANRPQVIIKAERDIPHGFVQEVTRIVAGVEGVRFNIGVQEKRTTER